MLHYVFGARAKKKQALILLNWSLKNKALENVGHEILAPGEKCPGKLNLSSLIVVDLANYKFLF